MLVRFACLTALITIAMAPLAVAAEEAAPKPSTEQAEKAEKGEQKRPKSKRSFNSISPNVPGTEPDTVDNRGKDDPPRGATSGSRDK